VKRFILLGVIAGTAVSLWACGLSETGTSGERVVRVGNDGGNATDASTDKADGAKTVADGASDGGTTGVLDAADANDDGGDGSVVPVCQPLDGGLLGALDLSKFSQQDTAQWDENSDGRMTLTNSNHNDKGSAWSPSTYPPLTSLDLTFQIRVGPGDTSGDGIAFAVLQATSTPSTGDNGDGIGVRGITASGFAVVVDMYKNGSDATDDAVTTLKLVTMPSFVVVAHMGIPELLNDGNEYAVDVQLKAGSLSATLHGPTKTATVTNTSPAFVLTSNVYLGVTAATGSGSDSHNEVGSITLKDACY
jgi:hypothetical protein